MGNANNVNNMGKEAAFVLGVFTSLRNKNNPRIKKVRVFSTIEYYLSD